MSHLFLVSSVQAAPLGTQNCLSLLSVLFSPRTRHSPPVPCPLSVLLPLPKLVCAGYLSDTTVFLLSSSLLLTEGPVRGQLRWRGLGSVGRVEPEGGLGPQ